MNLNIYQLHRWERWVNGIGGPGFVSTVVSVVRSGRLKHFGEGHGNTFVLV